MPIEFWPFRNPKTDKSKFNRCLNRIHFGLDRIGSVVFHNWPKWFRNASRHLASGNVWYFILSHHIFNRDFVVVVFFVAVWLLDRIVIKSYLPVCSKTERTFEFGQTSPSVCTTKYTKYEIVLIVSHSNCFMFIDWHTQFYKSKQTKCRNLCMGALWFQLHSYVICISLKNQNSLSVFVNILAIFCGFIRLFAFSSAFNFALRWRFGACFFFYFASIFVLMAIFWFWFYTDWFFFIRFSIAALFTFALFYLSISWFQHMCVCGSHSLCVCFSV